MDLPKDDVRQKQNARNRIFFIRQFFSCSSVVLNFFMYGLYVGAPTVIIPQLRREANSIDVVSPEMASWLSSVSAYVAISWAIILPLITYHFGRKILLILVTINVIIGNIMFYISTNIKQLIISQILQGVLTSSITTVTIIIMSEYTSPKYRGLFLTIKSATLFWGIWVSNAIGTFYHWKNIGIVVFVCCIYNLSTVFCCESPYWLATKGRFDECAKVHRWLKGTDKDSEDELSNLILLHKEHLNVKTELGKRSGGKLIKTLNILRSKRFCKSLAYTILPICLYNFSGKLAYTVYAIDIIKKITSSEEMAYKGMLILDGVTVLGMYIGCVLSKFIRRRVQLLVFSFIGVSFLYVLSFYLYIVNLNIILENKYISLFLLTGFSISISCGPIILSSTCSAELAPLRYRSYFLCFLSLIADLILATVLKFSPFIFKYFNTHGAFLFYAVSSSIFTILLYKYLPETKDKTIQEIQEYLGKEYFSTDRKDLALLKKSEGA